MQVFLALLTILLSIIGYVIYLSNKANNYWKERGIPHVKPNLFFGNVLDVVLGRYSQGQVVQKICEKFPDEPLVGIISFLTPVLVVKDPTLLETVLIRDFTSFANRGVELSSNSNPLQTNLFNMTGPKWRAIRSKLSPIFTSGKLKNMFNNMTDIGSDLTKAIEKDKMDCVDMYDITGRFAMDTIGRYGFGMSSKSLENPESEFTEKGKQAVNLSPIQFLKMIIVFFFPYIAEKLGIFFITDEVQQFFIKIIQKSIDERLNEKVRKCDFIDLMLQLKTKGTVEIQTKDESDDYLRMEMDNKITTQKFEMTDDLLIGQAFTFLVAGLDGFATALTYTFYELAKNPEIQDKLREEIQTKINENGILNYDTIKDMTYLDMCIKESLRRRSPSQLIVRVCTKDYTFPNGLVVKKGHMINIPVEYIHMDPKNFPEPEKYDPERYHPDIKQTPCTSLPFGEGPRMCIGMRFSILQIKYGMIKIIMNYKLELNPKTKEPLQINTRSLLATPKDPLYFNLTKIKN